MEEIRKKQMEYNNGDIIPFEIIKENREVAVKQIAEGNIGLEKLMNTCIELNYRTIASCGDETPYIVFELTEENKEMFFNLCRIFSSSQNLYNSILIGICYTDGICKITFHLIENTYNINGVDMFNMINNHIISYDKSKINEQKEFLVAKQLTELIGNLGFNNRIEFLTMKKNSNEITETPDYQITIHGNSKEDIFALVAEYLEDVIYAENNYDFIISEKYYDIENFKVLDKLNNNAHKKVLKRTYNQTLIKEEVK